MHSIGFKLLKQYLICSIIFTQNFLDSVQQSISTFCLSANLHISNPLHLLGWHHNLIAPIIICLQQYIIIFYTYLDFEYIYDLILPCVETLEVWPLYHLLNKDEELEFGVYDSILSWVESLLFELVYFLQMKVYIYF